MAEVIDSKKIVQD